LRSVITYGGLAVNVRPFHPVPNSQYQLKMSTQAVGTLLCSLSMEALLRRLIDEPLGQRNSDIDDMFVIEDAHGELIDVVLRRRTK
jgi:hypothetical protein